MSLPATLPVSATKLWIRAILDGVVGVHAPGSPNELRMTLSSKAVPIAATATGTKP